MFCKSDRNCYREVLPGISMKTLVHGERTLMTEFRLKKGSILPSHEHLHEQTGYLVSGRMVLSIGNATYEVISGDSWNIPGGVSHYAEVLEDSVAIEVFSPRRDEYIQ
ncbi:MAG: Cupin domain protein [Methanomethylovorans sp. PtaU1.Bin093]|nr:MAG: Cupin domain protein [Methanomethylovorans sp. PtaU1.Bin093]